MKIRRAALRLGLAAGLMGFAVWLAAPEDGRSLSDALASSWRAPWPTALAWGAVAAALFGAAFAAVGWRFRVLMRAAGLEVGAADAVRGYVVANFLNLALPAGILGDAYRVADARRATGHGAESLAMVGLERILGLSALGCLVAAALPFAPVTGATRVALAAFAAGCAALTPALMLPGANRALRRLAGPLSRLSSRAGQVFERALAALSGLSSQPATLGRAFAISLLALALPVTGVWALAQPLDATVAPAWYAVLVPLITLASLAPVSIGGAGVREALFVALFGAVGMRPEVALALALSTLAVTVTWGAVGALLFARGSGAGTSQETRARGPRRHL